MRRAIAIAALGLVAGCGEPLPPPDPPGTPTSAEFAAWATETAETAVLPELPDAPGLQVETRVEFAGRPDLPHRLTMTWDGDRARVELMLEGGSESDRAYEYRVGEQVFGRPARSSTSSPVDGEERAALLRRIEAKRLLWTDPSPTFATGLEVEADSDGRVAAVRIPSTDGQELWRVLERDPDSGLPLELRFELGGQQIWTERLLARSDRALFSERFFWPPDRWENTAPPPALGEPVRTELQTRYTRDQALEPAQRTWAAASALAEVRGALPAEARVGFVVDAAGRPTHLRWTTRDAPLGEDWVPRPAEACVAIELAWNGSPPVLALGALASAAGRADAAGAVLRPSRAEAGRATLLLSLDG
ncbi:MAG: hypothetical protein AAFZ65_16205 [Planctomycetota bacterium]